MLRHLRKGVSGKAWVPVTAIGMDAAALVVFLVMKGASDPVIVVITALAVAEIFAYERYYSARIRA